MPPASRADLNGKCDAAALRWGGEAAIYPINEIEFMGTVSPKMISQKAKYALRALVALARAGESMMIGEIAAQERIPRKFLEQILLELKRHGIVMSKRGKLGGYMPADAGETRSRSARSCASSTARWRRLPCLSRIAYRRCADCRTEEDCEIRHVFAKVDDLGPRGARPHHHRRRHRRRPEARKSRP